MKMIASLVWGLLLVVAVTHAQQANLRFTVSMPQPSDNVYNVVFNCEGVKEDSLVFKMPVWTPGYYQLMNYPEQVSAFAAVNHKGEQLQWKKKIIQQLACENCRYNWCHSFLFSESYPQFCCR